MKYTITDNEIEAICGNQTFKMKFPAGTIINLEPVEEVKVKAFVPNKKEGHWYIGTDFEVYYTIFKSTSKFSIFGLRFRTKEDAQIAQAKVIELFNSFK